MFSFQCRSGLHTIPHNAKIHFNYANFLKDSGRTREAIEHYETALQWEHTHTLRDRLHMRIHILYTVVFSEYEQFGKQLSGSHKFTKKRLH